MNTARFLSRLRQGLIAVVLASFLLAGWAIRAGRAAATITVNSFADSLSTSDHACTLREAIIAANKDLASSSQSGECPAGNGTDTIILPPGVYTLTRTDSGNEDSASTGDLDIKSSLVISPTGPVTITAVANFSDRIFQVISGNVTVKSVTISNGKANYGGAFHNAGVLTITDSTLSNNKADVWGGAIKNAGTLNLTNVTLSGNSSKQDGGGLYNYSGTSTLINVTITNNTADSDSNGSGNGGGVFRSSGYLKIKNTLIAGNLDNSSYSKHRDCYGTLTSLGNNLIGIKTSGCSGVANGVNGDLVGTTSSPIDPKLGPLQNNGGSTHTHALLSGSPAIDAGTNTGCPAADQRGVPRPQGVKCDIGAYEAEPVDPVQTGPTFTVNTAADANDGACTVAHCTLREAILAANARPNASTDQIIFNIPGAGPHVIQPASALPAITDAVLIDGTTDAVVLDGANAGAGVDGLTLNVGGNTVRALTIRNFGGNGIRVNAGTGSALLGNSIYDNGLLGIDLGGDGVTPNDAGDPDAGANDLQNFPALIRAFGTTAQGWINGAANTQYTLEFFANAACDPSGFGEGQTFLGSATATTDGTGDAQFNVALASAAPDGQLVTATATDPAGNTSEFSQCVVAGAVNDSWVTALRLNLTGGSTLSASVDQFVDRQGQSRWFKFTIQPGSRLIVTLTNLPANYDLTIYKDIAATLQSLYGPALDSQADLAQLGAEFAPDAFAPDAFAPDAFAPDAFAPDAFAPDAFAPDAFAPDAFAPDAFAPDAFAPDAFAPDAFAPDAFAPDAYAPDAFAPDAFAPDAFAPDAFAPDAYASAQTRSLIGVSAFEGTSGEGLALNTWNNTGDFYVRVRGRNGAFSLAAPFHLQITLLTGACSDVDLPPSGSPLSISGDYRTLILTDPARMGSNGALASKLAALAARPEVDGYVVDVSGDPRVVFANAEADAHPACPFAKNLVAQTIKDIVDEYRADHPGLEYIVIVGNDNVIPFFRHPDQALLANEANYVPPVKDNTASQASLKLSYVLSQDDYGAAVDVSRKVDALPVPHLAVGRLVENQSDVIRVLDAYLSTANGVVDTPDSSLVTGYDFLEDAANAVNDEFQAGLGAGATLDTLIAPRALSPQDPLAWTADDLRAQLLGSRHDLMFLAGHFSGNSALAADYLTRMLAAEVAASSVNLENAIIFSAGCHAGYNIVDPHAIPNVTGEPDWAEAFASQGATLIAGTGYQYGDTDFIEYSERLYLEFARQLRAGTGPVAVGQALVAAKQAYLASTPQLRGLHEKALLEATLFGLPMLKVNLPAGRGAPPADGSIVGATSAYGANPGLTLGLRSADVTVNASLTRHDVPLETVGSGTPVVATYFSGADGVVSNPAEPVLPLEARNVSVSGLTLRGVGFRGGDFSEENLLPLIGAPTTELRGVHTPFVSDVFFPVRPWSVNYFDALGGGATYLNVIAAQAQSSAPGADTVTLRTFSNMSFRLFYSGNVTSYDSNEDNIFSTPALADAPNIVHVASAVAGGNVNFAVNVVGNPAAGIQEVWVTYTALDGPFANKWQSLDLTQSAGDSTLWTGTLALGSTLAQDVRFMVQAVNGVGLVGLDTNLGAYYTPGVDAQPTLATMLAFQSPPASGNYGAQTTFSAKLMHNGSPLADQRIIFRLGSQSRQAFTDGSGVATVTLPLLSLPGAYEVRASFTGDSTYIASNATSAFTVNKAGTQLEIEPSPVSVPRNVDTGMVISLIVGTDRPLGEKTVFFIVTDGDNTYSLAAITDYGGRAALGKIPLGTLPPGLYNVNVYFSGNIPLPGAPLSLDDVRYHASTTTGSLTLINLAPEAAGDAYEVNEDAQLNVAAPGVLGNDDDPDDDALSASLAVEGEPLHGALTLNADGSFQYTPAPNYHGPDSFTYVASDGFGGADAAVVNITVKPVNDDPTVNDDEANVSEDSEDNAIDVLANDSIAPDVGETLSVTGVSDPPHGAAAFTAGGVTYTPDPNYFGDDTFTYTISDGNGGTATAAVTVHVANVNDDPAANDDEANVDEDSEDNAIDVLANDSIAPDVGETLSVTGVSDPPHGAAAFTAGGVTYTPDPNYFGDDTFTYTISDGNGGTATAAVTVHVANVNDDPTANDDAATVVANSADNPIDVLANDSFAPDPEETLTVTGVSDPPHGAAALTATGVTYTPDAGYTGPDSFTYTISDGNGGSATATVHITVVHDKVYAVQDQNDNDTQFFTISLEPSHTVTPLGPLQPNRDIEGLDLDAANDVLYASSGKNASPGERGCLYTVDKSNGALTRIGCTGFTKGVQALAVRPTDNTLWGWAHDKGLIVINTSTGAATIVLRSSKSGSGLAWNNDGTLLYMVAGRTLFAYNPVTNDLTQIASNLPGSNVEALEMRPDGLLAVGVHGSTTLYAYDVDSQQVVSAENISVAPYDDVEGVAWPN